jgi:hypothetical protein
VAPDASRAEVEAAAQRWAQGVRYAMTAVPGVRSGAAHALVIEAPAATVAEALRR